MGNCRNESLLITVLTVLIFGKHQMRQNCTVYTTNANPLSIVVKNHSFLKKCCAWSSFEQNKILHLLSAKESFVKVLFFSNVWKTNRLLCMAIHIVFSAVFILELLINANQRMKVVENYIWFPVVYENSLVYKFEIPAPLFFSVVNMQLSWW